MTEAPTVRALLGGVVVLVAMAALGLLGGGSRVALDCSRERAGADLRCHVETVELLRRSEADLVLREATITLEESDQPELLVVDDATTTHWSGGAGGPLTRELYQTWSACADDDTRLHCDLERSSLSAIQIQSIVAIVLLLPALLLRLRVRTRLLASRTRGELVVERRRLRRHIEAWPAASLAVDLYEEPSRERLPFVVKLLVEGEARSVLGARRSRAEGDALLAEVRGLLEWLQSDTTRPVAPHAPAPNPQSCWVASTKTLRPGLVPTHTRESQGASTRLGASVALFAVVMGGIAAVSLATLGAAAWPLAAVVAAMLAPAILLAYRMRRRRLERIEAALEVAPEGVWRTHAGARRLVRWSEIASVKEHVLGRYTFRDTTGETLFTVHTVTADDGPMAKALIAVARAGVLPEQGSTATVEIGASSPWMLGIFGGPALGLLALLVALTAMEAPPTLAELAHRTGTVSRFDRVMSRHGTVQFELADDDFAFYVVRGRDEAEQVLETVRVGDQVEIWHDRAERPFGPIGAVFQMRAHDRFLFTVEARAAAARADAIRIRWNSLVLALVGLAAFAVSMTHQSRRAVLQIAR